MQHSFGRFMKILITRGCELCTYYFPMTLNANQYSIKKNYNMDCDNNKIGYLVTNIM